MPECFVHMVNDINVILSELTYILPFNVCFVIVSRAVVAYGSFIWLILSTAVLITIYLTTNLFIDIFGH